jgi:hypothetical protein
MLKPALLANGKQAWNFVGGGYGLGVFVGKVNGVTVEKHSGGWDDASCQLARFPDGLTVAMLTNVGHYEQRSFCGERIAQLFNPKIRLPAVRASKLSSPAETEVVQRVVDNITRQHRIDKPAMTEDCYEKVFADMHRILDMTQGKLLRKFDFLREIEQDDTKVLLFRATFARKLAIQAAFGTDRKIVELQFLEFPTS